MPDVCVLQYAAPRLFPAGRRQFLCGFLNGQTTKKQHEEGSAVKAKRKIGGIQSAFTLIAASTIALSAPAGAQQPAGEPIKIGVIVALTGAGASLGIPERNGAVLAEKIINSEGGVNGRPVQLIIEDDGSNPDGAISKANNLIHREKVSALIGSSQTASTVAVGGLSDPMKMPQVALSG